MGVRQGQIDLFYKSIFLHGFQFGCIGWSCNWRNREESFLNGLWHCCAIHMSCFETSRLGKTYAFGCSRNFLKASKDSDPSFFTALLKTVLAPLFSTSCWRLKHSLPFVAMLSLVTTSATSSRCFKRASGLLEFSSSKRGM